MRSELVFRASDKVANRYLLCQATAKTTRCLHFASAYTTDAITDAFVRMAAPARSERGADVTCPSSVPAAAL